MDEIKTVERQRRHPLQVTAARLRDALKDFRWAFSPYEQRQAEMLADRMDATVDQGLTEPAPAPLNPGQPFDQRSPR